MTRAQSQKGSPTMAAKTIISILNGYFNTGEGKRPVASFRDELARLSAEEKLDLAQRVCAITGDTIQQASA